MLLLQVKAIKWHFWTPSSCSKDKNRLIAQNLPLYRALSPGHLLKKCPRAVLLNLRRTFRFLPCPETARSTAKWVKNQSNFQPRSLDPKYSLKVGKIGGFDRVTKVLSRKWLNRNRIDDRKGLCYLEKQESMEDRVAESRVEEARRKGTKVDPRHSTHCNSDRNQPKHIFSSLAPRARLGRIIVIGPGNRFELRSLHSRSIGFF